MKIKKLLMTILVYLLTSVFISSEVFCAGLTPDENGVIPITSENQYQKTKYYEKSKDSPFGIIGGFHLVGFNSVLTDAHTNGNILTKLLKYDKNFGTNGVEEISYARQIEANGALTYGGTETGQASILVVGQDVSIGSADGGNSWTLNGNKLNHPKRKDNNEFTNQLWQDTKEKEFINLNEESESAVKLSQQLSKYKNKNTKANFQD